MPKRAVIAVPKSLDEAAQFLAELAEIGQEQRATDKIRSGLNTAVDKLKTQAMADDEASPEKNFRTRRRALRLR